jgi:ribosome-binding protein aMBF1 (putative translation factor)
MPRKKKRRDQYGEELSPRIVRQVSQSLDQSPKRALARDVQRSLMDYRWTHSLSQQQLAERLGVKQPQVARLESGLINPNFDTLLRISERLGIEFTLEVRPAGLTVRHTRGD